MSATSSDSPTDRPARGLIAAGIPLAAHALILFASSVVARLAAPDGGPEVLVPLLQTFLLGEALTGLACVVGGAVQYRRGRRYTGLGLMGGWVLGLPAVIIPVMTGFDRSDGQGDGERLRHRVSRQFSAASRSAGHAATSVRAARWRPESERGLQDGGL